MQSSALPLGHAADEKFIYSSTDFNSKENTSLLIICNGHGEDIIALEIIKRFLISKEFQKIEVMPLVGNGYVFDSIKNKDFKKIGYLKVLPSGGFSNQSLISFLLDLRAGMLLEVFKNLQITKLKEKEKYKILAIGDFLPLFFAWSSQCSFGFIGTPKSDYTWSSGPGWSLSDLYHRLKGSEWDPWEILIMKNPRCKTVIMRDGLTANNLNKKNINAKFLGNPMMDFLDNPSINFSKVKSYQKIIILIGSRYPEALNNFKSFLTCLLQLNRNKEYLILLPLTSNADFEQIEKLLIIHEFIEDKNKHFSIGEESIWKKNNLFLLLGSGTFNSWARIADVGLSNAGTATEQIAGLGIPSLSLPGKGPQFTKSFAKRQQRLLGGSVRVCKNNNKLIEKLYILLENKKVRNNQGKIGMLRMGTSGASQKIVDYLNSKL
ncbi:MAG: hypothetical protein CMK49_00270 [Prochlorococcus sp. SP3034]|nr:hypothetical protein [Prochlorococcus sp. SP3034]